MLKRFLYLFLLSQMLLIACSNINKTDMEQANIENIRKSQEIAKISKDIYDLHNIVQNEEVDLSFISDKLKASGMTEYESAEELITALKSMSNSLEDENISLDELEKYSKLTGLLVKALATSESKQDSDSLVLTEGKKQESKAREGKKVVTLAEVNSYDTDSIEDFELPEQALLLSKLDIIDTLYYYNNELYTGMAYSRFKNGQIGEFKTIKKGFLSGPVYAWYEDGSYAMQANFLDGYLTGRFIAWSEVGDIIYDIYFNKGQFNSDLQYERDTSREEQDSEATEGESDSEGNSGE